MSALQNPEKNEKLIRNTSIYLYEISSHFRRLINYFARMSTLSYIVLPYKLNINKVNKTNYLSSLQKSYDALETMNLKHEINKIYTVCFREDVFYGYIYQTKDSYYIKQLPSDYCKISSIEDGCFLYSFDFSYFNTYKDDLEIFGDEFVNKYNIFKSDSKQKWQELESKNQICIKVNEDIPFPLPPFIGVFAGIYDIDDYKSLQKVKTELGNYKALSLKVPSNDNGEFIIPLDDLVSFYKQLVKVLPDNVGAFMTPMEVTDHSFEKSGAVDDNNVSEATKTFWNDAGVSSLLFGGDKQTSAITALSIKADEEIIFALNRQIERNINKILKQVSGTNKFKISILDVTYYNQNDMFNMYLKAAQASLPTTTMACATIGISPFDMMSLNFIENDILDIFNKFKPLQLSYTQTSDKTAGAPTQDEKGAVLSDSGEASREQQTNTEYVVK